MISRRGVLHDHGRTCRALEQAIKSGELPESVEAEAQGLIAFYGSLEWRGMAQQVKDRLTAARGAVQLEALRRVL